jgi:hypothetical protein
MTTVASKGKKLSNPATSTSTVIVITYSTTSNVTVLYPVTHIPRGTYAEMYVLNVLL